MRNESRDKLTQDYVRGNWNSLVKIAQHARATGLTLNEFQEIIEDAFQSTAVYNKVSKLAPLKNRLSADKDTETIQEKK